MLAGPNNHDAVESGRPPAFVNDAALATSR